MTEWILSSSILILIVITMRTVFKGKISLRLQYAVWGLVLLRLLIPVSFGSSNLSVANLTEAAQDLPVTQAIQDVGNLNIPSRSYEDAYHQVVQEYEAEGIDVNSLQGSELEAIEYEAYDKMKGKNISEIVGDIALVIWFSGIILVGIVFLVTNSRFHDRIMTSRYALDVQKNNLDVYATGEIDTPCLFGIRNPAIYVTYPVADNQTLLHHTLEHEATHHRHGDHIWAVLRCVCLAIHWYNPLVWWAAFLSQRDAELACDEATIKRLGEGERAEYGRTLIGMTCQKKANVLITATTMNSGKSGIKERIMLIAKKPKMALYTLLIVVLVASIAVGCTFTGAKDDSTGDLTGTKVFSNQSEVTGMAIHALPDAYTLVDSAYLSDMTQWALGFEYGETIDSNAVMDPGSNTFSVTLYYADGTEQTCYLDFEIVDERTYAIKREDVPGCWHDIWADEDTAETDPFETETPDDAPPEGLPDQFAKALDDNKVCIAVQPTGLVSEGGGYLYIIPEDQVTLQEYYTAANASAHTYTKWDSSNKRAGWWIVYQGQWWQVTESGAMFGTDPVNWDGITIDADDAKKLYEFCDAAVKEAGIAEPVRPGDITEIKSATLYWNGTHTVTDEYALNKIEKWIANSREEGSVSCWFSAQLTLELENGETKTIAMATDSCATWMSEGVAYGFGEITDEGINGNEEFYSLFAPSVIHEKVIEGRAVVTDISLFDYLTYMNWSRYANQYGVDETFALMDMIEKWAAEEPTFNRFGGAIGWSTGLDGAYADYYAAMLARLYELAPSEFAWACLGNATDANEQKTLELLAYNWNITTEEARAKLEAEIPQD